MTPYAYFSLLQGAGVTVALSLLGIVIGVPLGLGSRWCAGPGSRPDASDRRVCERATRDAAGHAGPADLLRAAKHWHPDRSDPRSHPHLGAQYLGFQLRDLASRADRFPQGTVGSGAGDGHDLRPRVPAYRLSPDLAHQPALAGERDDLASESQPGDRRHRRRGHHPSRRAHWSRDL